MADDSQTTRWVRRIKPWNDPPNDGQPWVADARTFDIPETVAACIRNAAPGIVAIALSRRGGRMMMQVAEQAASERGIRVLWWNGPHDPTEYTKAPSVSDLGLSEEAAHTAPTDSR